MPTRSATRSVNLLKLIATQPESNTYTVSVIHKSQTVLFDRIFFRRYSNKYQLLSLDLAEHRFWSINLVVFCTLFRLTQYRASETPFIVLIFFCYMVRGEIQCHALGISTFSV